MNGLSLYAYGDEFRKVVKKQHGEAADAFLASVPDFTDKYQTWYSEAKMLVRQLLPDRSDDFSRFYEKPKTRKDITHENYTIEDALNGLIVTHGAVKARIAGPEAAISNLQQQVAIIRAANARFESSLFDIRQLLPADLFDSELDAANHLLKNRFSRAAGALAGVVLEKHLGEVASSHSASPKKKDPTVADLNDALKAAQLLRPLNGGSFSTSGIFGTSVTIQRLPSPHQIRCKTFWTAWGKLSRQFFDGTGH